MTWETLFQPVVDTGSAAGRTVGVRPQQAELGNAIVKAITEKSYLIAECPTGTGKSWGALIPIIHKIKQDPEYRAVISTETLALQDQYIKKDLPFLHKIYGDFKYTVLKGRSNYFCLDAARANSRGTPRIANFVKTLGAIIGALGDGEKADIEKRLGQKLSDEDWGYISGSMQFCNDNGCADKKDKTCFAARARSRALASNIVVANHAILQVDTDMKDGSVLVSDGMLGEINTLVVDEAHTLEQVLVDGWTESITAWELQELGSSVSKGFDKGTSFAQAHLGLGHKIQEMIDDLDFSLESVRRFFSMLYADDAEWKGLSVALCEQRVMSTVDPSIIRAMETYEQDVPEALDRVLVTLVSAQTFLRDALAKIIEGGYKGRRDVNKGIRACKTLMSLCETMKSSIATRDGRVMLYGVPHVIVLDGYFSRQGERKIRVRTVPLDVSKRASQMWRGHTSVLLSATLTDLTDGSFNYVAASLGFPEHETLKTASPFDYAAQQRIYITPGTQKISSEVPRAQYSFDELVDLIKASNGRALVLFTAKAELEECADWLRRLRAAGHFEYPILVQEKGVDKQELVERFKTDTHSVLLASKSFFTGVDFVGEACSLVVLCKFPLPRYDVVCRNQVTWWRERRYPRWYEREALTVFGQAAGRLIRANDDHGVVALLDQRVTRADERVYQTARIGVNALGSGVIRSVDDVREFLS